MPTTDAAIQDFDGTPTTVWAQTSTLNNNNWSTSTTGTVTEFDNSTDKWPSAIITLQLDDGAAPWSSAPAVGTTIDIYMAVSEVAGGATDVVVPTAILQKGAVYVQSLGPYYAVDEDQPQWTVISLIGVRKCYISAYINTGVNLVYTAGGNNLKCEGCSLVPSA